MSVAIAEAVRFVDTGYRVCRVGFEVLGQRAAAAQSIDTRIAVAETSRRLGACLALWDNLRPDAVALRALSETVQITLDESSVAAALSAELAATDLADAARAIVGAIVAAVEWVIDECSPMADANFRVGLEQIAVQVRSTLATPHPSHGVTDDGAASKIGVLTTSLLLGARNSFSSPLTVPN